MKYTRRCLLGIVASLLSLPAMASLIVSQHSGGTNPDPLFGYDMIAVAAPSGSATDRIPLSGPLVGEIQIRTQLGDPLSMAVVDAFGAGWWQYDHGNVYGTHVSWIELIMPSNVRAISFHVGATGAGRAWVQAISAAGEITARSHFSVGPNRTQGVSVHSSDACGAVSTVIIEPWMWGFGNVAVSQGDCVTVPEPGTLVLLATGLLALGLLRVRRTG